MYRIEYYQNKRGEQPLSKWLNNIFKSDAAGAARIDAQIQKLREHGLKLINTNMMKPIIGTDSHFYELRPGPYRIIFFYDVAQSKFILLHGFRKTKQRQDKEIAHARLNLQKYLLMFV